MTRRKLGLPPLWLTIATWLAAVPVPRLEGELGSRDYGKKFPNIPILDNYRDKPDAEFWKNFPKTSENFGERSIVNYRVFRKYVNRCWVGLTTNQRWVAKKALENLRRGAKTDLSKTLKSQKCKNAKSAEKHGEQLTDTLAGWIEKGFVAGPFENPPFRTFRENPLMAVVQPTKIRPIMNLSAPKGSSFNEAVNENKLRKLKMSSARKFGENVIKLGEGALMAKYDISDAYKLIKTRKEQWGLFGFKWLGKYFYDSTTVFGSKAAPDKFDSLPETVVNMSCYLSKLPKKWVHRQLDDVPFLAPKDSKLARSFAYWYEKICKDCNIPLAPFCPAREKAFGIGTGGTVLGINFNTENLTWNISETKRRSIRTKIDDFAGKKTCNLREIQSLHGKLNDFGQMCEFMKGYRYNIIKLLRSFGGEENSRRLISRQLKTDLRIWTGAVEFAVQGLPIADRVEEPPIKCVEFATDAAGAAFEWNGAEGKNVTTPGDRGAASVAIQGGGVRNYCVVKWPDSLMFEAKDSKGTWMGQKSSVLEMVGVLLPFLTDPKSVQNKYVIIHCDNNTVVNGWRKRYCKNEPETSALMRALHEVEAYLECQIFIKHVKRMSTKHAALADALTRSSTTTREVELQLTGAKRLHLSGALSKWLNKPKMDWNLGTKCIEDINKILYK